MKKIANLKISQKLTLSFGIVFALLVVITVLSNIKLIQLNDSIKLISKDRYPKTILANTCLLYTSPSPRDRQKSRMPSSA